MNDILLSIAHALLLATGSVAVLTVIGLGAARFLSARWQVLFWCVVIVRGMMIFVVNPWKQASQFLNDNVRHAAWGALETFQSVGAKMAWWERWFNETPILLLSALLVWFLGSVIFFAIVS